MISKKFGFWCLLGAGLSSAIYGSWYAPFIFMTMFLYDAIKPEDKNDQTIESK